MSDEDERRANAGGASPAPPSPSVGALPNGMSVAFDSWSEIEYLYKEVFSDETYMGGGVEIRDGATIVDLGANVGMFSLYAASKARSLRIVAVEPVPRSCHLLRTNLETHGLDATVLQAAAGSEDREVVSFFRYPHLSLISGDRPDPESERLAVRQYIRETEPELVSQIPEPLLEELLDYKLTAEEIHCRMVCVSSILESTGLDVVDLLKVDVEGAELDVLQGIAPDDWPKFRQMTIEVHDTGGRLAALVELLEGHGFAVDYEQQDTLQGTNLYQLFAVSDHSAKPS